MDAKASLLQVMDAKAKLLQVMERTFQVPSSKLKMQQSATSEQIFDLLHSALQIQIFVFRGGSCLVCNCCNQTCSTNYLESAVIFFSKLRSVSFVTKRVPFPTLSRK